MKTAISEIRKVVERMNQKPRFIADSFSGVAQQLTELSYDKTVTSKYPIIFLDSDILEERNTQTNVSLTANLILYFIDETKREYTPEESIKEAFDKSIIPLYQDFFKSCFRSNIFVWDNTERIQHIDFLEQKTKNLYKQTFCNDIVDCLRVEINLKFTK